MAALARYGSVSPDEFGRMTPAQTRRLARAVGKLVDDEWTGFLQLLLEHAKLVASVTRGG